MISAKANSIMNKGIEKYSKKHNTLVQIRMSANETNGVKYEICTDWNPVESVSFKDLMDTRIDLLGIESLSEPFMRKSLKMYSDYYEANIDTISMFLFKKNGELQIAIYKDTAFKELLTLEKQFKRLGV